MTLRFSPALQNFIAETDGWKDALDNGSIEIYSGAQPATADLAVTGNLLVTITNNAGALTPETRGLGIITLSVGAVGTDTVLTITLLGVEIMGSTTAFLTSLTATAAAIALKINRNPKNKFVVATSSGAVITLTAVPGFGSLLNSAALATTVGGNMVAAVTSTSFGSGTGGGTAGITAVNGITMDFNAAAGVMTKNAIETWSGTATGAGTQTAGWFRYKGSVSDGGALDSSAVYLRMDGAIAVSGAEMNMSSTSITNGALQTVSAFTFTVPAA
jgi:hypothetical protein